MYDILELETLPILRILTLTFNTNLWLHVFDALYCGYFSCSILGVHIGFVIFPFVINMFFECKFIKIDCSPLSHFHSTFKGKSEHK